MKLAEILEAYLGKRPVYVIGGDYQIEQMFKKEGFTDVLAINSPTKVAEQLTQKAVVVFTGGHDVSPILYGEKNTASANNINRDANEMLWFRWFKQAFKIGICRGGQFLNVMNDGRMKQHIEGHTRSHFVLLDFAQNIKKELLVTSTHHQGIVLGPNTLRLAVSRNAEEKAVECAYAPLTQSFIFQPHPEYEGAEDTLLLFKEALSYTMRNYI